MCVVDWQGDREGIREPVSEHLKALVCADLWKEWHGYRVRQSHMYLREEWGVSDDERLKLHHAIGCKLSSRKLRYMYNRLRAFYMLQSVLEPSPLDGRSHAIPGRIFASIYQEWIRCYGNGDDNDPASLVVDFGHFLAHPVQVMPKGPTTISGILHAHCSRCAKAYELPPDSFSLPFSTSSHSLLALYRALVVIVDKIWEPLQGYQRESDGLESMHNFALNQTVIIACTGANTGLSALISLESLKKESFPLEASLPDDDTALGGNEVTRVSLATAVQFITSLEKRENLANPNFRDEKGVILHDDRLDPSLPREYEGDPQDRHRADSWTDDVLILAEKYGYYNVFDTRHSLERV
ncbi:MAG: hypothetical protein L6R37_004284 [Teloschistes peruensis]|nr:MAG: hypothetical protein L6R37_004284 [Teloschistes peruensis]